MAQRVTARKVSGWLVPVAAHFKSVAKAVVGELESVDNPCCLIDLGIVKP